MEDGRAVQLSLHHLLSSIFHLRCQIILVHPWLNFPALEFRYNFGGTFEVAIHSLIGRTLPHSGQDVTAN